MLQAWREDPRDQGAFAGLVDTFAAHVRGLHGVETCTGPCRGPIQTGSCAHDTHFEPRHGQPGPERAMKELRRIHIQGYRSLRDVSFAPGRVTVLIGPNGAGKSNLLSFLRLLTRMRSRSLRRFVGLEGGASALLHRGRPGAREIAWRVETADEAGAVAFGGCLARAAGDQLVFLEEFVEERPAGAPGWRRQDLGEGHGESRLDEAADSESGGIARAARGALRGMNFFHVHDTSASAPLRSNAPAMEHRDLRSDASNLAAHLLGRRRATTPAAQAAWRLFEGAVRQIAPYIKSLEPTPNVELPEGLSLDDPTLRLDDVAVRLEWIDEDDNRFGVSSLSDGTLRAIALFAALTQPADRLPAFITIDEPELGLHPAALALLMELVRAASARAQVVLATQSPALLDLVDPAEVVVAERVEGATRLRRLDAQALAGWLEDYSLGELFDKNVLGGRP